MATIRLVTTTMVVSLIVSWRSGHLTRSNSTLTERKKASRPVFFEFGEEGVIVNILTRGVAGLVYNGASEYEGAGADRGEGNKNETGDV